jgi:hypothetical protein
VTRDYEVSPAATASITLAFSLRISRCGMVFAGFMTTPDQDLTVADEPTSPRDWLTHGGDVNAVCELAAHLDTW